MRNLYCNVEALRKQVFAAVAKLAYEGGDYCSRMEKLPYEIIPGEVLRTRIFSRCCLRPFVRIRSRVQTMKLCGMQRMTQQIGRASCRERV